MASGPAYATHKRTVTQTYCLCLRCQHEWQARSATRPLCCPACKAPNWDLPKLKRLAAREAATR